LSGKSARYAISKARPWLKYELKDIGLSLETTILIYAAFNLVAALISFSDN
jgi:hypothetical protein